MPTDRLHPATAGDPAFGVPSILFLDQTGKVGGAELVLKDVARHFRATSQVVLFEDGDFRGVLRDNQIRTTVLELTARLKAVRRDAHVLEIVGTMPTVVSAARRLARLAADHDVIYANTEKALILGVIAGRLAKRPVIWHLHDILSPDHFSALNRFAAVWLARWGVHAVIAVSEPVKDAFVAAGGRCRRLTVISNGIDPAPFDTLDGQAARQSLRTRLGLTSEPLVGMFGRLAPWKGQHVFLEALAMTPGVHGVVVGGVLFGEDAYARHLQDLARRFDLCRRIHFLGHRPDVPALMKAVDGIVHGSTSPEPFGRVIVEGMLAGRPVIGTSDGAVSEILDHGRAGILVPPGDSRAMAAAIRDVVDGGAGVTARVECARRRAMTRYGAARMLHDIDAVVRAVVVRPGNPVRGIPDASAVVG